MGPILFPGGRIFMRRKMGMGTLLSCDAKSGDALSFLDRAGRWNLCGRAVAAGPGGPAGGARRAGKLARGAGSFAGGGSAAGDTALRAHFRRGWAFQRFGQPHFSRPAGFSVAGHAGRPEPL